MHKSSFFQCKMPHNNNHGHITIRSNTLQWLTTDDKPFIQLDNILSQNSNYITSEYKYNQIPSPCSLRAGPATGILFLRKIYAIARTQRDIGSFRASSFDFKQGSSFVETVSCPCRNANWYFCNRPSIPRYRSIEFNDPYSPSCLFRAFKSPRLYLPYENSLYPFLFTSIITIVVSLDCCTNILYACIVATQNKFRID